MKTILLRNLVLSALLALQVGCALLPHHRTTTTVSAMPLLTQAPVAPSKKWHIIPRLPKLPIGKLFQWIPFFRHKQPPPRAVALQRVGTISTISTDGSYVIILQEPGVALFSGRDLVVTAVSGEPIRLRTAESQPPYFIADVKSGHPEVGQTVFQ